MNHDVMQAPTRQEALKKLLDVWTVSVETEYVPLADCLDRISSKDIYAMYTIPQKRISAMDGYAVKSQNFADGMPDISKWTMSVDFTPADTGDDFPDEYDTVIPVEQLHFGEDGKLTLAEDFLFRMGSGIRPAGSIMKAGDLLIRKNTRITPELQANLAVGGIRIVSVLKMPVVAFIPTGSELTSAGLEPQRGQNVECNSLLISAYLKKWGAKPVVFPIVRDMPDLLQKAMDEALKFADIVILNGGSSKGTEDYTSRMMEQRSSYFEHTVRTVPGRPVGIAMIDGKPVINMPGPTMAAWVVSDWLLYPMICHYYGISVEKRKCVQAFLTADMKKGPPVEVYSKVRLENRAGLYYATPIGREARNSEMLRDGLPLFQAHKLPRLVLFRRADSHISTHALFMKLTTDCKDALKRGKYTLFLDETIAAIEPYDLAHKDDINYLLSKGSISIGADGFINWIDDDMDTRYNPIKILAQNHSLFYVNQKLLMWRYPPEIFSLFDKVYIMTYLFPASILKYYFDFCEIPYQTKSIQQLNGKYDLCDYYIPDKADIKKRIHIYGKSDLNDCFPQKPTALSANWFKNPGNASKVKILKNNMYNFFTNKEPAKSEEIIWTTFKDSNLCRKYHR